MGEMDTIMDYASYRAAMAKAMPHGPDEPCTCDGYVTDGSGDKCECWPGHVVGCTCDIEWDTAAELQMGMGFR